MADAQKYIKELDLLMDEVERRATEKNNSLNAETLAKLLFAAHEVGITKMAALKIIESGYPDYKAGAMTLLARIKKKKRSNSN
jgi:hypothetical protein